MVFDCTPETTLGRFFEWVEDRTMIPSYGYYILRGGRPISISLPEDCQKTFRELEISQEDTLHLMIRLHARRGKDKIELSGV